MASAERSSARAADDGAPVGDVALDQTFDADSLFHLRSAVAAHGSDLGMTEQVLEDLVLVAHELASNAVRHGLANPTQPGRLRLWRDGDLVFCEVSDHGPGIADPDTVGTVQVPPGATGGRGLWIVRQMVASIVILTGSQGTTLTTAMPTGRADLA
jgi:anti-sigma regulatory factor (Ser/Thr protein kinase)